jgi:hypothetical protein
LGQPHVAADKLEVPEDRRAAFFESAVKLARANIDVDWTDPRHEPPYARAYISSESELTPETLRWLYDVPGLATLRIVGATHDESCLTTVSQIPGLERLALVNVQLRPARLQLLAELTRLTGFLLAAEDIDAAALDSVPTFPRLRLMSLCGPELTEEDVNRLAARMPKEAMITWYKRN